MPYFAKIRLIYIKVLFLGLSEIAGQMLVFEFLFKDTTMMLQTPRIQKSAVATVLLAIFGLTACDKKDPSPPPNSQPSAVVQVAPTKDYYIAVAAERNAKLEECAKLPSNTQWPQDCINAKDARQYLLLHGATGAPTKTEREAALKAKINQSLAKPSSSASGSDGGVK